MSVLDMYICHTIYNNTYIHRKGCTLSCKINQYNITYILYKIMIKIGTHIYRRFSYIQRHILQILMWILKNKNKEKSFPHLHQLPGHNEFI